MAEKQFGTPFSEDIKTAELFLTKNLYSNRITSIFFGVLESGVFKLWSAFSIIMGVLRWKTQNFWVVFFSLELFLITSILLLPFAMYVAERFKLRELVKFSEEVAEVKPGVDMERWDIVASNMNKFIQSEKLWSVLHSFYDGGECFQQFRRLILNPYSEHTSKKMKAKQNVGLKPYAEEAIKSYQRGIDKYWRDCYGQILDSGCK